MIEFHFAPVVYDNNLIYKPNQVKIVLDIGSESYINSHSVDDPRGIGITDTGAVPVSSTIKRSIKRKRSASDASSKWF